MKASAPPPRRSAPPGCPAIALEQLVRARALRPHGVRRLAVFLGLPPTADMWEVLLACRA